MGCAERYLRGAGADLRYAETSFIALLIAVPVSFGIALFLTELAHGWLKRPLGIAIELLAAIPSIVYGMWGLFIFAPLFAVYFREPVGNIMSNIPIVGALFSGPAFGIGILAAGVILAIMIIPYIAAVMRDVFEQTPVMMKESAYGIGCTTGSYLAYRSSVHQKWCYRRHYVGAGPRAW